jgi:hypothetical protein
VRMRALLRRRGLIAVFAAGLVVASAGFAIAHDSDTSESPAPAASASASDPSTSATGTEAADLNQDGLITLSEAEQVLTFQQVDELRSNRAPNSTRDELEAADRRDGKAK